MATTAVTLNIDNTILATAVAALNWRANYQATLPDGTTNPITPNQNAKLVLKAYVMQAIKDYNAYQTQLATAAPADNLIS